MVTVEANDEFLYLDLAFPTTKLHGRGIGDDDDGDMAGCLNGMEAAFQVGRRRWLVSESSLCPGRRGLGDASYPIEGYILRDFLWSRSPPGPMLVEEWLSLFFGTVEFTIIDFTDRPFLHHASCTLSGASAALVA